MGASPRELPRVNGFLLANLTRPPPTLTLALSRTEREYAPPSQPRGIVGRMPAATQQAILDALGLSAMTSQAQRAWDWAEKAVVEFLGYTPCQAQYTKYVPMDESNVNTNDPVYVLNSSASRAVPGFDFSARVIQLRDLPVRSIVSIFEDATGYFGQEPNSFGPNTQLVQGSDFFLKMDTDGLSWNGQVVRRAFWFPMTIGSVKITYVAGFTDNELQTTYSCFGEAVCIAAQYRYLQMKAVSLGQFPDIASEGLGGGASATYREAVTYGEAIPDRACDLIVGYRSYVNERL